LSFEAVDQYSSCCVLAAEGKHGAAHCVTCWSGRRDPDPRSEWSQSQRPVTGMYSNTARSQALFSQYCLRHGRIPIQTQRSEARLLARFGSMGLRPLVLYGDPYAM